MTDSTSSPHHPWQFFVAGGVNQVRLTSAEDLRNLRSLDPKLWVALSCPVFGTAMDERTMALIDVDHDGRVRIGEVLAAIDFLLDVVRDSAAIFGGPGALPLSNLREDTEAGRTVLASARAVLSSLGRPVAELRLADIADIPAIYATMPLNGDGVAHPGATADSELSLLIGEICIAMGGVGDRSGQLGVTAPIVEAFFADCAAFAAWTTRAAAERETLLPFGDDTRAAVTATLTVAGRIDDFFSRCRLVAYDGRQLAALEPAPTERPDAIDEGCSGFASAPLARVQPGASVPLPLGPHAARLNPAWSAPMTLFQECVARRILGDVTELTEPGWLRIKAVLSPPTAWLGSVGGASVAGLGIDRVVALLTGDAKERLLALIASDEARRPEAEAIGQVERAVRYYLHLGTLLKNFVNFAAFYGRREKATFQAGTAYFDQRSCELVLQVADAGRHATLAGLAGAYLAYMDCERKSDARKLTICVAVTDGDSDNLMVGRNGLFYDRQGREYDARITRIVDNPISLRQAFFSPYKKAVRMVEDLVAKRAAAADAESSALVNTTAEATASGAPAPAAKRVDIGTVAAIGVAVGGISAAIGALLQAFFGLGMWMPVGFFGLVLLISGPSVLIASLKLRRRNLGPILDADGWAINAQARINIPFGRSLTALASLPRGSSRDLRDPFATKRSAWPYVISAILILAAALFTALTLSGRAVLLVN